MARRVRIAAIVAGGALALLFGLPLIPAPVPAGPAPVVRGEAEWADPRFRFGGFSGLAVGDDGRSCVVVNDRGYIGHCELARDAGGRLAGARLTDFSRLLLRDGTPVFGFMADAEAVRVAPDGAVVVGFEGMARVARYASLAQGSAYLGTWDAFREIWGNKSFESVALVPGGILAVVEAPEDGRFRTFVFTDDSGWATGPDLATDGTYMAVDADLGPDGRLYLLERRYTFPHGFMNRITVRDWQDGPPGAPEVLAEAGAGRFGNLEGMDVRRDGDGTLVATLISDNNFVPLVPTMIVEFELAEGAAAGALP